MAPASHAPTPTPPAAGGGVTYKRYRVRLDNLSVTGPDARGRAWKLLSELARLLDPAREDFDHQLINVDLTLTAQGVAARVAPGEGRRTAGWFLVGGGVMATGIGIFSGLTAESLAHGYNTYGNSSYQDPATKARGIVFRTSADVAFLGALALGGVGVYFLLTPADSAAAQARVVLAPGFGGIAGAF